MAKEIYNKNAREAHLMAEAYSQVNEGHTGPVPDWEEQAGLKDELEANRKAARKKSKVEPDPLDDHSSVEAYRAARGIPMPSDEEDAEMWDGPGMQHDQPLEDKEKWYGPGDDPADMPPGATWDAEWANSDHLADVLAALADTWQTGEYSDTDKESLKAYINKFIESL